MRAVHNSDSVEERFHAIQSIAFLEKGTSVMQGKVAVFVSLTVLVGLTCLGCNYYPLKSDPDFRYNQIKVDSVAVLSPLKVIEPGYGEFIRLVPTTSPLAVSDTMRIGFYGWVGPTGGYGFSHFDTTRIDLVGYKVSVWGKDDLRSSIRPLRVLRMRGSPPLLIYPPLRVGTWIFLVSQPDGSVLRKEVVVR